MRGDDLIRQALNLETLRARLPERPRVIDVEWYKDTDSIGDPALYIMVILDEATPEEERQRWAPLEPIYQAIRDALNEAGVERWPYVRYNRRSDLRAAG